MNLDESLVARLKAHVGLTALVGARVYPQMLPQSPTLPAVTYERSIAPTEHIMAESRSSIEAPNYRLQCWGSTITSAVAVAEQVDQALDAFSGMLGGVGGVNCWITKVNSLDLGDDQPGRQRRINDYEIWFAR